MCKNFGFVKNVSKTYRLVGKGDVEVDEGEIDKFDSEQYENNKCDLCGRRCHVLYQVRCSAKGGGRKLLPQVLWVSRHCLANLFGKIKKRLARRFVQDEKAVKDKKRKKQANKENEGSRANTGRASVGKFSKTKKQKIKVFKFCV